MRRPHPAPADPASRRATPCTRIIRPSRHTACRVEPCVRRRRGRVLPLAGRPGREGRRAVGVLVQWFRVSRGRPAGAGAGKVSMLAGRDRDGTCPSVGPLVRAPTGTWSGSVPRLWRSTCFARARSERVRTARRPPAMELRGAWRVARGSDGRHGRPFSFLRGRRAAARGGDRSERRARCGWQWQPAGARNERLSGNRQAVEIWQRILPSHPSCSSPARTQAQAATLPALAARRPPGLVSGEADVTGAAGPAPPQRRSGVRDPLRPSPAPCAPPPPL